MLTNLKCKNAKHGTRAYKMFDSEGLFLHVTKTSKIWRFRYKLNKKEKLLTFGKYPEVTLNAARKAKEKARDQLREKRDPGIAQKKERLEAHAAANNFENAFRAWIDVYQYKCSKRSIQNIRSAIERYIIPVLGNIALGEITPPMILHILKAIEKTSPDKAHRVRMWTSAVFRYGIAVGLCTYDPAAQLTHALKPKQKGRQPAITDLNELLMMIRVVESYPSSLYAHLALRFVALTSLRSGEVRSLSWDDVDGDILRIPAAKMKMKRDHVVPLARQAVEIINFMRHFTSDADYIFPSIRSKRKQMSDMTLSQILKRSGYRGIHVPHGFRSSFSSIMNERRPQDRHIIDLMLAHVNRNNVEASYNRAEHIELRRNIAQEWADLIAEDMRPPQELIK